MDFNSESYSYSDAKLDSVKVLFFLISDTGLIPLPCPSVIYCAFTESNFGFES